MLSPLEALTRTLTARRVARPGWRAPVPVICAGNAGVGGAGKTPLCLDLAHRLNALGHAVHILTRGHGGRAAPGALRVDPARHGAALVGDEALLLAEAAPTWVGPDRAVTGRAAVAAGAGLLLMDDGLQNPSLCKDFTFLVIDGAAGFGNGRLLPAGPLREPVRAAAGRCGAAVIIGADDGGAGAMLPDSLPVLAATLAPGPEMRALAGQRVLAFAGIGRPGKFFATLAEAGIAPVATLSFADHHRYTAGDLARLHRLADAASASLVTTWKDYVRISPQDRAGLTPLGATLTWRDETALMAVLRQVPGLLR